MNAMNLEIARLARSHMTFEIASSKKETRPHLMHGRRPARDVPS